MPAHINKTTLISIGWFVAMTLFAVGIFKTPVTFIHVWQWELPSAVLLAASCLYFTIRPPKEIALSKDELRFVILPIAAFIAWSTLSALWAQSWKSAIHHALVWAMYLIFYLIVRAMVRNRDGLRSLGIALVAALVVFSIQAVSDYTSSLAIGGENTAGNFAKIGEQIVTVLPLAVVILVSLRGRSFWLGIGVCSLMWLLVFSSWGRVNVFLFAFSLAITGSLLLLFAPEKQRESRSSVSSRLALLVASMAILTVAVQMFTLFSEKPNALAGTAEKIIGNDNTRTSNQYRLMLYAISQEMTRSNPLTGIGADNFGFQLNEYRKRYGARIPENATLAQAEDTIPERAHSEPLQVAAELGAVGIAIAMWFLAGLLKIGLKSVVVSRKKDRSGFPDSRLAVAAVIGLGAFCISSLASSFSFRLIQTGFVFFFVLAIAYRSLEDDGVGSVGESSSSGLTTYLRSAAAAGLIASLLLIGYWTPRLISIVGTNDANRTRDVMQAIPKYELAERLDDENPLAFICHGLRLVDERRYSEAVPLIHESIRLGRGTSSAYSYLATSQTLAGDNLSAEQTMAEALKMYPRSPFVLTRYAHLLRQNGRLAESEEMLARARARNLADANSWWTLLNEGSRAASRKVFLDPEHHTPLMDLKPLDSLYAVMDERKIRFPEEMDVFSGLKRTK